MDFFLIVLETQSVSRYDDQVSDVAIQTADSLFRTFKKFVFRENIQQVKDRLLQGKVSEMGAHGLHVLIVIILIDSSELGLVFLLFFGFV